MKIEYTRNFTREAKDLPKVIKSKLSNQLAHLPQDPFYPKLHTKPLTGNLAGFYSFRVTRDYRVIFTLPLSGNLRLISIGHRKDIYRKF